MGCSSQGGWLEGWGAEEEVAAVVVLLRRVVGTGYCMWSELLPVVAMSRKKNYARSPSSWSGRQSK